MEWESPFIIYRMEDDGAICEVFHTHELKKAKYWLTYIAHIGDVLARTPAHPRHKDSKPSYFSHKACSGNACSQQFKWKQQIEQKKLTFEFPTEQLSAPVKDDGED